MAKVDMTPEAIERRLRIVDELREACRRLQAAKKVSFPGRKSADLLKREAQDRPSAKPETK